jgi:hypothetical protein
MAQLTRGSLVAAAVLPLAASAGAYAPACAQAGRLAIQHHPMGYLFGGCRIAAVSRVGKGTRHLNMARVRSTVAAINPGVPLPPCGFRAAPVALEIAGGIV